MSIECIWLLIKLAIQGRGQHAFRMLADRGVNAKDKTRSQSFAVCAALHDQSIMCTCSCMLHACILAYSDCS